MDKEIRWNYWRLVGNSDYEHIKNQVRRYKASGRPLKVLEFLVSKTEMLVDQAILSEDPRQQCKMIQKVRVWFDKHMDLKHLDEIDRKGEIKITKIKPQRLRIIRKQMDKVTDERLPRAFKALEESRFLKSKKNSIKQWALDKSRSSEDILYRSEIKHTSHLNCSTFSSRNSSFYTKKLMKVYNKHKNTLSPGYFNFKYQPELLETYRMQPESLNAIENLKQRLAAKKISISTRTIEPISLNDHISIGFPKGGEYLLKFLK